MALHLSTQQRAGARSLAGLKPPRESGVQYVLVRYLRLAFPQAWVGAIPGGDGKRTHAVGYVAGTPDLLMVLQGRAYFIETKRPRETAKKHQRQCHADIARAGAPTAVCTSIPELEAALDLWGLKPRARVAA